jgi:TetR/AcrR family fatty acid metabolism transcriptional regulator
MSGGGDKKSRILESAQKVFAERGFYGAKVSDIATEAGVADGTIYLYFKSKDDVLISLFEAQMERVNAELTAATRDVPDAPEKLRRFLRAWATLVATNRHATEAITVELRQSAKFMKEYDNPRFGEFLKLLAGVIDEGQKQGKFRADVPAPIAARALFGALDELALWWCAPVRGFTGENKMEKFEIAKVADWIGALVLEGLETKKEMRS